MALDVDAVEQRLHVRERRDVDPALPHLAARQLVVRIAAHQRRQVERDARARCRRRATAACSARSYPPASQTRKTAASSRACRGSRWDECRACMGTGQGRRGRARSRASRRCPPCIELVNRSGPRWWQTGTSELYRITFRVLISTFVFRFGSEFGVRGSGFGVSRVRVRGQGSGFGQRRASQRLRTFCVRVRSTTLRPHPGDERSLRSSWRHAAMPLGSSWDMGRARFTDCAHGKPASITRRPCIGSVNGSPSPRREAAWTTGRFRSGVRLAMSPRDSGDSIRSTSPASW